MEMNKHHIIKIYEETARIHAWNKKEYYQVHFEESCCGIIEEKTLPFDKKEWEEIKSLGYYMA
ncbi:MAG: hypothetical protein J5525_12480 [Lachnospiraceae bacterium]|nr:hypothetical protein [Lachnospiraceae bacterium]